MICEHLGPDTGETAETDLCCSWSAQPVHACKARSCKVVPVGRAYDPTVSTCHACPVRQQPPTFPTVQPTLHKDIVLPGKAAREGAYNCSLHLDDRPGYAFAYRAKWSGSTVRLGRLDNGYRASGQLTPTLTLHPRAIRGQEDPRLFKLRGEWYFSFTGYEGKDYFASCLYAKVNPWPFVERVYYPHYPRRNHAEKNWGFFDCEGELHAVYSIGPGEHRVLKIDGEHVVTEYSTDWNPGWTWGIMRGGASPTRVGDEYYSFFHGVKIQAGTRHYTIGLYTFEAKPPFRPLRVISEPLVIAGFSHWCLSEAKYIVFPCGAALKGGRWHVSAGEHDSKCSVFAFDAEEIEKALTPLKDGIFARTEMNTILNLNGWCTEAKAKRIAEIVSKIPERVNGVEIGVFAGRSLFAAAIGCRANPNGGKILGIDSYDPEENLKGVDTEEHRRHWTWNVVNHAKASMFAAREKLGLELHCDVLVSTSANAVVDIPHALNFLHIDGNHSSAGAVSDAELYLPRVVLGGLVLVDDTHNGGKPEFLDGVMDCVRVVEQSCDLVEDHHTWRVYRKTR